MSDYNTSIIEEFRAHNGKVGGSFSGATMLILHHLGAKTGQQRENPLVYQADGENFVIFASKGGAPAHPSWFHNLAAHPHTTIEVGDQALPVVARVAEGDERERLWTTQKQLMPGFAEYEKTAAGRTIPVVVLERSA